MNRYLFLLLFLLLSSLSCLGQAISDADHTRQLNEIKKRANEDREKNLYRFGLIQLQRYDQTFDQFYKKEIEDSLHALNNLHKSSNAMLRDEFDLLKKKKEDLAGNQAGFNSSYTAKVSKATGIILVLLTAFISVLFWWKKKLTARQSEVALMSKKNDQAKLLATAGEELIRYAEKNLSVYSALGGRLKDTNPEGGKISQLNIPENSQWREVMMHTKKINQIVQSETLKNSALVSLVKNESLEKSKTDINQLCLQYLELVKDSFPLPDGQTQIKTTTDLEKNLPPVNVIPAAIGHLLVHILTNAMQSTGAMAMKKLKGYEPRVSLSTRILPRFVQIRINDNGVGVEDKYIDKIKDAFFTLKQDLDPGLGLYISDLIMKNHQGEIKIESDKTRGTDVYLKFFIN